MSAVSDFKYYANWGFISTHFDLLPEGILKNLNLNLNAEWWAYNYPFIWRITTWVGVKLWEFTISFALSFNKPVKYIILLLKGRMY